MQQTNIRISIWLLREVDLISGALLCSLRACSIFCNQNCQKSCNHIHFHSSIQVTGLNVKTIYSVACYTGTPLNSNEIQRISNISIPGLLYQTALVLPVYLINWAYLIDVLPRATLNWHVILIFFPSQVWKWD